MLPRYDRLLAGTHARAVFPCASVSPFAPAFARIGERGRERAVLPASVTLTHLHTGLRVFFSSLLIHVAKARGREIDECLSDCVSDAAAAAAAALPFFLLLLLRNVCQRVHHAPCASLRERVKREGESCSLPVAPYPRDSISRGSSSSSKRSLTRSPPPPPSLAPLS